MEARRHLVDWLRDAHGMEQQAISTLERQLERLESYPELAARVQQHLVESRRQADQLDACIRRLGGSTSAVKDIVGKLTGNAGAFFNAAAEDEVVKNMIAGYTLEHFEIASYKALIAAADLFGEAEVAQVCRDILREEEAMAAWIDRNLAELTKTFIERDVVGLQAKH
jgi:ferritin-like metal-binding protein YciE